jgi:hypothetical protein
MTGERSSATLRTTPANVAVANDNRISEETLERGPLEHHGAQDCTQSEESKQKAVRDWILAYFLRCRWQERPKRAGEEDEDGRPK